MTKPVLQVLPLQLIDVDTGVLLKRGNSILNVNGTGAKNAVRIVLSALAPPGGTVEEVQQKFSGPDRNAVGQLIEKLVANRFAVPANTDTRDSHLHETHMDIFYWHFGETADSVAHRLNKQRITILGVNTISRQLCSTLQVSGFTNFEVIDCPTLRNTRLVFDHDGLPQDSWIGFPIPKPRNFDEWKTNAKPDDFGCLIGTSDFGGSHLFKEWNHLCVKNKLFFFPILLQDQIGYVGPLVVPDQTACYECFLSRQHSHKPISKSTSKVGELAFEGQGVIGFHPAMASALADIAAFELTKFFSGIVPGWNVGTVLEMNLLASRMTSRKILKIPRCSVCSPLITRTPTNPKKSFSFHPIKENA